MYPKTRILATLALLAVTGQGVAQGRAATAAIEQALNYNLDGINVAGAGIRPGVSYDGYPASPTDSDGDGVPDATDNCTLAANPAQVDSNGDGYGNACDADLNDDCIVNPIDLGLIKAVFFSPDADADLNGDGTVNPIDLGIFKSLFFMSPGPSALGFCPAGTVFVSSDITQDTNWNASNEYVLQQPIFVTGGATLTVQPGTVIRGVPESAPGAGDWGALVVTRDARIRVLGTVENPVIMTDLNDDNVGASAGSPPYDDQSTAAGISGQWGGLVLLGPGFVAANTPNGPDPGQQRTLPGLPPGLGDYGGCIGFPGLNPDCDDTDSGEIHFLSLRYAGGQLGPGQNYAGLTLAGVGRATWIDHIELFQPAGDGLALRGGAARIKHVAVIKPGDDGIDIDEGYRGSMQFVYVQQGEVPGGASDKAIEIGGGVAPADSQPYSTPVVFNVTGIGLGGQDPDAAVLGNTAIRYRDNGGGGIFNGAFIDFSQSATCIEGDLFAPGTSASRTALQATPGQCTGPFNPPMFCTLDVECPFSGACLPFYQDAANAGAPVQIVFESNTFACFGQNTQTPGDAGSAQGAGCGNEEHYGTTNETTNPPFALFGSNGNDYLPCDSDPIRELTRSPAPGAVDPIIIVDPRPTNDSPLLFGARPTPDDDFFLPAPYRGAFDPESNWLRNWSTTDRLDYFPIE